MRVILSLTITATQAPLMNAIKLFLDSYSVDDAHLKTSPLCIEILRQRTHLYNKGKTSANSNPSIILHLGQVNYIVDKLIPLLSNLSFGGSANFFFSKKLFPRNIKIFWIELS